MFERLMMRAAAVAAVRAGRRRALLAGRMRAAAVPGLGVHEEGESVVLTGRGLRRRMLVDPELRWLVAESKDER